MSIARAIALTILLCFTLPVGAAHAQKKPSKAEIKKAKHHYNRAQKFKELKEYNRAADEFLAAYKLYEDAEFFFNAAEMYRLDGNNKLAAKYFRAYLELQPKGRVASAARNSLVELQPKLLAAEAERQRKQAAAQRKAEADAVAAGKQGAGNAERDTPVADQDHQDRKRTDDAAVERSKPRGSRRLQIASIASGAIGAASLGLGVYFGLDASSARSELVELQGTGQYDAKLDSRRASSARRMVIFSAVGAAGLLGSGALYVLSRRARTRDRAGSLAFTPQLSDSAATLWLQGRF